jgi:hypothetical protein
VANNSDGFCGYISLSPLYLICQDTGAVQTLDPTGVPPGGTADCGDVFYDNTFTAAF